MKLLGLTGGVGMGKSACAQLLHERKVPVIDTDVLARQVVEPGQPGLAEIRELFGPEFIDSNGCLRRDLLAQRVFGDESARRRLEALLHPRIRELWRAQAAEWQRQGHRLAAVIIPLLFETSAETELTATICIACSAATQQERLRLRGWSSQQIAQRIAAQWPIEKKMLLANFVIWTEAGLDLHAAQLERILEKAL
jgi:dephospho-CoA kinase